jgi:hypothetical protein
MVHDALVSPSVRCVRTGTGLTLANELVREEMNLMAFPSRLGRVDRSRVQFNVMISAGVTLPPNDDTRLHQPGLYTVRCICSGLTHLHANVLAFEHPYVFGPTGLDGRFHLPGVPPGTYRLVCWHGPFTLATREDPPGALQYEYGQPLEVVQDVVVEPGRRATADFTLDPVR